MIGLIKKIIKGNNFLSLAANLSTSVMGLISFVILMRILSIDDFGKWVLFTTPASLIDMLRMGLTREATVRYISSIDENGKKYFLGSSWFVGLITIISISIILYAIVLIFPTTIKSYGYDIFFYWYPVFAIANLPWNYAWSILQAEMDFKKIFWIRFFNLGSFLLSLFVAYVFAEQINVTIVVLIYIITNVLTSFFCLYKKWTGIRNLRYISREKINQIINFGKYSMASSIGSSLLKSADNFIISFSTFLGPYGVALYAIPLKFIELLEIPLRSFAATAFPKLSKASIDGDKEEFNRIFYQYTGAITVLFIGVTIFALLFNQYFILFLGGSKYKDSLQGLSYVMIAVIIYGLLLPVDRFTGIALSSLNKPQKNFYKIIYMAAANIIGDFIAVFVIHKIFPDFSVLTLLLFVGIASIIFTLIGLVIGFKYLREEVDVSYKNVFIHGFKLYRDYIITYAPKIFKKR